VRSRPKTVLRAGSFRQSGRLAPSSTAFLALDEGTLDVDHGSRLIDNLNASIHLYSLLTDLFLIDKAITSMGVDLLTIRGGVTR
jgi:hypothetical protein